MGRYRPVHAFGVHRNSGAPPVHAFGVHPGSGAPPVHAFGVHRVSGAPPVHAFGVHPGARCKAKALIGPPVPVQHRINIVIARRRLRENFGER